MTEKERMLSGVLYRADDPELRADSRRCKELLRRFNELAGTAPEEQKQILRQLLGRLGEDSTIVAPLHCDYGCHTYLGNRVYINYDLIVLDVCDVVIGDDVLIGPRVSLLAASHPIDPEVRASGLEYGAPIRIGDRVWLGGGVTVNPGVTIGSDSVIGSGSVVTRDIPSGVIAAGNPCRVLRPISDQDKARWRGQRLEYENF